MCLSWYVEDTGRNSTLWPGSVRAYQRRLARCEIGDCDAELLRRLPSASRPWSKHVIVNTSSAFGLVGMPFQSAYCTSKFAVRGFTESLRHELRGTGARAVTIHPGGVKTHIARNARYHVHPTRPELSHEEAARHFDAIALTNPERAAEIIHAGVKAGRGRGLVGPDAYMFDALARLAPTRYYDVLALLDRLAARR